MSDQHDKKTQNYLEFALYGTLALAVVGMVLLGIGMTIENKMVARIGAGLTGPFLLILVGILLVAVPILLVDKIRSGQKPPNSRP
jgi:drug/metabolite transporter (DMT)-like permease